MKRFFWCRDLGLAHPLLATGVWLWLLWSTSNAVVVLSETCPRKKSSFLFDRDPTKNRFSMPRRYTNTLKRLLYQRSSLRYSSVLFHWNAASGCCVKRVFLFFYFYFIFLGGAAQKEETQVTRVACCQCQSTKGSRGRFNWSKLSGATCRLVTIKGDLISALPYKIRLVLV